MSQTAVLDPVPARRRGRSPVVAGAVGLVVGALGASAAFLLADRSDPQRYAIDVFLTMKATSQQKAAVESALHSLHPVGGITFISREEAWRRFQKDFTDRQDLMAGASASVLPESFRLTTEGGAFDCATLAPVQREPGVDTIQVLQLPAHGHPGAALQCGRAGVAPRSLGGRVVPVTDVSVL